MKEDKLLIPIFMGMSFRNFLQTGVIENLSKNFDITFMVIKGSRLEKIINDLGYKTLSLERGLKEKIISRLFLPFEKIQYYSFYISQKTNTMKKYIKRDSKQFRFYPSYFAAKVISSIYPKYKFPSFFYKYFLPKSMYKTIKKFDKIFILSTDYTLDKALQLISQKLKVETNVIVHSWDNLPARGYIVSKPDKLLVWNESMVQQSQDLHGFSENDVHIVGVPQFNFYKSIEANITKDCFQKFYDLEHEKTITYTCSAQRVFPDEELFIEQLIEFVSNKDLHLILRLHPTERPYYVDKFSNVNNVILDRPSGAFAATITDNISSSNVDLNKFISLMKFSDVVINLASTISLDAMIFDTCVICPAYNPDPSIARKWNNAKDWYISSHFEEIKTSGAVKLAHNKEDLFNKLNQYLLSKDLDREARKEITDRLCSLSINTVNKISEVISL